jgi:hypothetical protein
MNEHEHRPRRSVFRWVLRLLYILTPAFVGVPVVAVVQHRGSNNVDLIAAFVLLGWMVLLTADLIFRWRDFVFLVLGAPSSLGLLGVLELPSNPLHISGGPCGGPTIILVLGPTAAVLLLGFVVGIVGSIVRSCSWLRSKGSQSK